MLICELILLILLLKILKNQFAGIANKPTAVATRDLAITGAIPIVPPPADRPLKESIIPQTVPNRPTNGATEPIDATGDNVIHQLINLLKPFFIDLEIETVPYSENNF